MIMDFELPEDVAAVRKKARDFALREFTPEVASKYDREETYPDEIRRKAFSEGFLDMSNPWGMLVAMEEFCRVDAGLGLSAIVPAFGSEVVMLFGNEEQKKKYLDPVLRGEKISGFAITDSGAGSDVAGISATLQKNGDGSYSLNGQKTFITNGAIADHFYHLAKHLLRYAAPLNIDGNPTHFPFGELPGCAQQQLIFLRELHFPSSFSSSILAMISFSTSLVPSHISIILESR